MPRYASLIYNGFWFAPEREMLQALIDKSQEHVDGQGAAEALQGQCDGDRAREPAIALRPGPGHVRGRRGSYDQRDAAGFIRLNALRLRDRAAGAEASGDFACVLFLFDKGLPSREVARLPIKP